MATAKVCDTCLKSGGFQSMPVCTLHLKIGNVSDGQESLPDIRVLDFCEYHLERYMTDINNLIGEEKQKELFYKYGGRRI
jgi:hypothetical protein